MVALSDRIVTAPEASLAPDLEAGDTAIFEPQRGEAAEVTIASVDASVWYVTMYASLLYSFKTDCHNAGMMYTVLFGVSHGSPPYGSPPPRLCSAAGLLPSCCCSDSWPGYSQLIMSESK